MKLPVSSKWEVLTPSFMNKIVKWLCHVFIMTVYSLSVFQCKKRGQNSVTLPENAQDSTIHYLYCHVKTTVKSFTQNKHKKHPFGRAVHKCEQYNSTYPVCLTTYFHLHHNGYHPLQCSKESISWSGESTLCMTLLWCRHMLHPWLLAGPFAHVDAGHKPGKEKLLYWVKEWGVGREILDQHPVMCCKPLFDHMWAVKMDIIPHNNMLVELASTSLILRDYVPVKSV